MPKSRRVEAIISRGLQVPLILGIATLLGSCGGSSMSPSGMTNVVVLLTSTANDQLASFNVEITSVTLSDAAGNSVTLYSRTSVPNLSPGFTEFMHLNGASEPLVTASVPQGTYTTATVKAGGCQFTTVTVNSSGGLVDSTDAEGLCGQGTGNTTVNLPSPLTISGSVMALSFNLQVPQSYTLTAGNAYTISPVFTVTPIPVSSQPTNDQNGKITGLDAQITSVNGSGNSFTGQTTDGISFSMSSDGNTQYQGITGFSSLSNGMFVNVDATIQANGSLLATRMEVDNPTAPFAATDLTLAPASPPGTVIVEPLECFQTPSDVPLCDQVFQLDTNINLMVSGQLNNLQNLPFTPSFSSSSLLLGQNVFTFSAGAKTSQGNFVATALTLVPQTVNGIVTSVSSSGSFSVYTVALAPYDLIPTTQQQVLDGFASINNPRSITVYADANTQVLQSAPVAVGSILRFRGLIFDDNGTLRMDCAKILDGVPE